MDSLNSRRMRVFISSTFEDMDKERSELSKCFRELSIIAKSYNVALNAIDLRWGIQPGESVVELCLNEIENSQPFFLGIIGDRYGTCPPIKEYYDNNNLQSRFGRWLKDAFDSGKSYTEIEMQFGAFMQMDKANQKGQTVFFVKKGIKDKTVNPKLSALIEKVECYHNKNLCDHDEYESEVDLVSKVYKYYIEKLNSLFPKGQLSEFEMEKLYQEAVLNEKSNKYIVYNDEYLRHLDDFVNTNKQSLILSGEYGVGKSSLLAYWIKQHETDPTLDIIYNFIGKGLLNYNIETISRQIFSEVACKFGKPQPVDIVTDKELSELFKVIPADKPLIIVLDGLSKLYREREPVSLSWLPIPDTTKVKVILSDVPEEALTDTFYGNKNNLLTIDPLSKQNKKIKLINEYLGDYGKNLTDEEKSLLASNELCNNCFILKTILNELIYFGKYDKITDMINEFTTLAPSSLFDHILINYETNYSEELVRKVLSLIAVSKYGLEENEILEILGIKQYQWSRLFCALNLHLLNSNGKVRFAHSYIKNAVLKRYANYFDDCRRTIAEFFEKKVKDESGQYDARAILELASQYYKLGDSTNLYHYLADYQQFDVILHHDYFGAGILWRYLIDNDNTLYDLKVYAGNVDSDAQRLATFFRKFSLFCSEVLSDVDTATFYMNRCLDIHTEMFAEQSFEVALDYERLGEISKSNKASSDSFGESLVYFQKAYEILTELPEDHNIEIIWCLLQMNKAMDDMGFDPRTNDLIKRIMDLLIKTNSLDPWYIANIIENLGGRKYKFGHFEEARRYYEDAIKWRKEVVQKDHPSIANNYIKIGMAHEEEKNFNKAIEYYQRAETIFKSHFGYNHDAYARARCLIGEALFNKGCYQESISALDESINIWNITSGKNNIASAYALIHKGRVYAKLDDIKSAKYYIEEAISIFERIGDSQGKIDNCYRLLAEMYKPKYPKIADMYYGKIRKEVNEV